MTNPARQYVRESGDRNEAVAQSMQESRDTGVCPFCEIVGNRNPDQPVILRRNGWAVIRNASPEEFSRHHFLAISVEHPESGHFDDLPKEVRSGRELGIQRRRHEPRLRARMRYTRRRSRTLGAASTSIARFLRARPGRSGSSSPTRPIFRRASTDTGILRRSFSATVATRTYFARHCFYWGPIGPR